MIFNSYTWAIHWILGGEGWNKNSLSLALFILSVEVLGRAMNSLFHIKKFKGFRMSKWIDKINHMVYVDDTIIFNSVEKINIASDVVTVWLLATVAKNQQE